MSGMASKKLGFILSTWLLLALPIAIVWLPAPRQAHAVEPEEMLKDPRLEARARKLSQNLRCLVCQNETIDESDAPLAKDLRILLRERLKAGDTDEEAIQYIVDRYGEYVLLKPRFGTHTLILWAGPFLVLALGLIASGIYLRRRMQSSRQAVAAEAPLTEEERRHLQELLGEELTQSDNGKS